MRSKLPVLVATAALAAPLAPAPAAVGDFRLPPGGSEQQTPSDRQGPIAPDVPASRRPAPSPAPAASEPSAPAEAVETPPPIVVPPQLTPSPSAVATGRADTSRRAAVQPSPTPVSPTASDTATAETVLGPATEPEVPAPASIAIEGDVPAWWPWALGGLLAFGAAGLAGWNWMRRRAARPANAPEIGRPRVAPAVRPVPPSPPPPAIEPLQVSLEPLRLSLTLVNATLNWRLEVSNRGVAALTGLTIGADMISAHASMTREEQLSGPGNAPAVQRIERLEPGESRAVEGEFRLPLARIVPIRQGNAALLVPLARFRIEAEGAAPLVRTFAVGEPGPQAALRPFRLDLGPRVYPRLIQRAFA